MSLLLIFPGPCDALSDLFSQILPYVENKVEYKPSLASSFLMDGEGVQALCVAWFSALCLYASFPAASRAHAQARKLRSRAHFIVDDRIRLVLVDDAFAPLLHIYGPFPRRVNGFIRHILQLRYPWWAGWDRMLMENSCHIN